MAEQVDEIIDHSVEIESNKRMRDANVNAWTLRFNDLPTELKFCCLHETMFKSNMVCCFIIWLGVVACQVIALPVDGVMVAVLGTATTLLAASLVLVMADEFRAAPARLKTASKLLVRHRASRTAFICGVVVLMSAAASVGLLGSTAASTTTTTPTPPSLHQLLVSLVLAITAPRARGSTTSCDASDCRRPEYVVFTWVLCLVALATSLKLYYLVKTALASIMVASYSVLILVTYKEIFAVQEECEAALSVSLSAQMLILLAVFLIMVTYHARLVEVTSRLDFLWKQQAERELADMMETRHNNTQLLKNILPDHVASHFLADARQAEELYSQSRDQVGVMFASIPNFTEFYSEDINKGVECIRLLNEIIVDFDELLDEPRFRSIEKIKTVGATYMAASSLSPNAQDSSDSLGHVCALVEFALAMSARLDDVNTHSFNSFRLRVGVSHGPLVGGVIGARKPVFDVWGNTVNEASRMDSTGDMGRIQVPQHTAQVLEARGFQLRRRGIVAVKGKGDMETYFVEGRRQGRRGGFARQPSQYNSLAAVVYTMVQRRKQATTPGSGAIGRAKSQQPGTKFSSMRVSARPTPSPVRRNTTRATGGPHGDEVATGGFKSQPNIRQMSVDPNQLQSSRSNNLALEALVALSQHSSAPQTPTVEAIRRPTGEAAVE